MITEQQIDHDYQCLKKYFEKLFVLMNETKREAPIQFGHDESTGLDWHGFFEISQFIKPDMLVNIYGFVDFWLKKICDLKRKSFDLTLYSKDIKGKNELDVYHKYLTKYVGVNLSEAKDSYYHLQKIRVVRNFFIHAGGHVTDQNQIESLSKIDGIGFASSLLIIKDGFVWESLDHAKNYLVTASKAGIPGK